MGLTHFVVLIGLASWYGPGFTGHTTASGEVFNQEELTAASQTIPLQTVVLVENLRNHRTVRVRVNDRGPYVGTRILDLSWNAARRLDMLNQGLTKVRITYKAPKVRNAATAAKRKN